MLIVVHELHTLEMFLEVRNSEISNEHIFLDLFSFRNLSLPALRGTAFVYFREATCYSNACLYIPRRRWILREDYAFAGLYVPETIFQPDVFLDHRVDARRIFLQRAPFVCRSSLWHPVLWLLIVISPLGLLQGPVFLFLVGPRLFEPGCFVLVEVEFRAIRILVVPGSVG